MTKHSGLRSRCRANLSVTLVVCTLLLGHLCQSEGTQYVGPLRFDNVDGIWYTTENGVAMYRLDTTHVTVQLYSKSDVSQYDFGRAALPQLSVTTLDWIEAYYSVLVPTGYNAFDVARALFNTGDFQYVNFESYGEALVVPSDIFYPHSPGDTTFYSQYSLQYVDMPRAWEILAGAPNTSIGVIDVGVDLGHPDLQRNLSPGGWDFYSNDSIPDANDTARHGTFMMGVMGATTNNDIGVAGVAGGWGGQARRRSDPSHQESSISEPEMATGLARTGSMKYLLQTLSRESTRFGEADMRR